MMRLVTGVTGLLILFYASLAGAQPGRNKVAEGNALYAEGRYDEALNKYQDALIDNPSAPEVHFDIGNTHYKKKNYVDARNAYQQLLMAPDPGYQAQAHYNIGNTLFREGKVAEAIQSYKKALDLNPDDTQAKYNLEYARAVLKEHAQKEQSPQQNQQQRDQEPQQQDQGSEHQEQQNGREQDQPQQDRAGAEAEQEGPQDEEETAGDESREEEPPDDPPEPVGQTRELTREEAEQLLKALENDEKSELKKARQVPHAGGGVAYDW